MAMGEIELVVKRGTWFFEWLLWGSLAESWIHAMNSEFGRREVRDVLMMKV